MPPRADLAQLIELTPDERLLDEDVGKLPAAVGQPESLPESGTRRRLVGLGATATGVSLIGGLALVVLGVVEWLSGGSAAVTVAALVIGIVLVTTHWGWVHVAELTANNLEARRHGSLLERRRTWLARIAPYARWEVTTTTGDDGSIEIYTVCYRPVASGEGTFSFVREETAREVHPGDEPAAVVAERAELVRRQAAAATERERQLYDAAKNAYDTAVLAHADEQQRLAAVRAASQALSERINTNLRDPPLVE